jgi:hypothetical protein
VPWNSSFQSILDTVASAVDTSYSKTSYEIAAYVGRAEMAKDQIFRHISLARGKKPKLAPIGSSPVRTKKVEDISEHGSEELYVSAYAASPDINHKIEVLRIF